MKSLKRDKEFLSAYLDGELSLSEKKYIEEKIKSSLELQKELEELKRLKELTSQGFGQLPDSPYFETRLMAELNSPKSFMAKFGRWIPALSITAVTLILMTVLKFYPNFLISVLDEQTETLTSFYKDNLQPLLYAANLSNEDLFNFAFYSELPLDEADENYLRVGYDEKGEQFFEINNSPTRKNEKNLEKFVTALNLNEKQREDIDSIISSYSGELAGQVLVSDKNTVAINPNLWNYQKALVADILSFAKRSNSSAYNSIIPAGIQRDIDTKFIHRVRELKPSKSEKYIFLTPDSIFTELFFFDEKSFSKEMKEFEKEISELHKQTKKIEFQFNIDSNFASIKTDSTKHKNFAIKIDNEKFLVRIPRIVIENFEFPNMDSITIIIEDALKNVDKFANKFPEKNYRKNEFKIKIRAGDSLTSKQFNFDSRNIDSLIRNKMKGFDSSGIPNFDNFESFFDSSNDKLNFFLNDSMFMLQNDQLQKQMKELKDEMRRFREEMQNLYKDERKSDTTKTKIKTIEI